MVSPAATVPSTARPTAHMVITSFKGQGHLTHRVISSVDVPGPGRAKHIRVHPGRTGGSFEYAHVLSHMSEMGGAGISAL
jgi:hypothetical protein